MPRGNAVLPHRRRVPGLKSPRLTLDKHVQHPRHTLLPLDLRLLGPHLGRVDQEPPPPLHGQRRVVEVQQPAHIEERTQIRWFVGDGAQASLDLIQLTLGDPHLGHGLVGIERVGPFVSQHLPQIRVGFQFFLQVLLLLLQLPDCSVLLKLIETPLYHIFRICSFHSCHVQQHVVLQVKRTDQPVRRPHEQPLRSLLVHLLIPHHDADPLVILATSTGSTCHLDVLTPVQQPVRLPVVLLDVGEDHCFRRHVDAHGKSFSSEQDLKQIFLKQQLHDFFQNG
mmetsp:Transcript_31558/g.69074  ORF Transcript_31558/g.69074 Transcript_31558/m.69074 type:complete len:281 (-) Transcript_31558:1343-2185(-)